jgi:hypothetical protein
MTSAAQPTIDYTALTNTLRAATDDSTLYQIIVDAPFAYKLETTYLFLGTILLLLINPAQTAIELVALSDTEHAVGTLGMTSHLPEDITIPVDYPTNIVATAIRLGVPQSTADWHDAFVPSMTAQEARFNQAGGAISYSAGYPLHGSPRKGALLFSFYQYPDAIQSTQHDFMRRYSQIVAQQLRTRHRAQTR